MATPFFNEELANYLIQHGLKDTFIKPPKFTDKFNYIVQIENSDSYNSVTYEGEVITFYILSKTYEETKETSERIYSLLGKVKHNYFIGYYKVRMSTDYKQKPIVIPNADDFVIMKYTIDFKLKKQ